MANSPHQGTNRKQIQQQHRRCRIGEQQRRFIVIDVDDGVSVGLGCVTGSTRRYPSLTLNADWGQPPYGILEKLTGVKTPIDLKIHHCDT